ncbi:polyamine-modulated factor 1-binding protein 1 isoform X2 [Triplophysa dalaica]|uniref:polyamine-modulated factor 1-binding protein 1 isoform X2 n=1 Tax=Triplophysa dalaica TaxID=1582913 RepID=UPI0024DFE68B|nr:polyamine-modulated factor 1-binding protein 1 isoform X2 [Triplophysa dalaica]
MMEPSQDILKEQLEKSVSDQGAKAKAEERDDLILELQNAITDLHQEMSLKEQQELHKLQHLLQLETRVKELQEQTQSSEETIAQLRQELHKRIESNSALENVLDVQEQRLWDLQRELRESRQEHQRQHSRNQQLREDARQQDETLQAQAHERVQQLEEELSRLKFQHSSVSQQLQDQSSECRSLQRAREELMKKGREWQIEKSTLHEQLNRVKEELHSASLREEEHRLKVVQIDELQREVDMTLALLEKEREDCIKVEERDRQREEQQKDKVQHQEELITELQRELEKIRSGQKESELREWKVRWQCVSENLKNTQNQLQQAQDSRDQALTSLKLQQEDVDKLHIMLAQREIKLEGPIKEAEARDRESAGYRKQLFSTQDALQQCRGQKEELCELRGEVQRWRQEAQEQKESQAREVEDLRKDLESTRGRLQLQRGNLEDLCRELETTHRQQRETDEEVSCREAALCSQDTELIHLKAGLLEAEKLATDAEARLQPLSDSLELHTHKYQACLNKITQLESTQHSQEQDLKEARHQLLEREEQILCLRAQVVALQGDLQVHSAQLESGDDALTALSQQLRDTLGELEHSRKHAQECEVLISTRQDTNESLRRQVEEQEETLVKIQADFSIYRSTHVHSGSDYECQLSRIQDLENALFQSLERCGEGARELRACQLELERHRANSSAELQRLQANAAEVESLEKKVANLEEELQAAQRHCAQKDQAIQKRDALLRQSEADLLQAREKRRGGAVDAEREVVSARGLEADLKRAKKEKRQREKECASLKTQLLKLRAELKDAQTNFIDTAQELAQHQERSQLLERGQRVAQQQLSERVAEVEQGEKAQRTLQAELKRLTDKMESDEKQLQDSRQLVERLQSEVSSSRQEVLSAQQEVTRFQQIQEELTISRENFSDLQTKLSEQEMLLNTLQERISELHSATHRLQEEEMNSQIQLQLCRKQLETKDTQAQKHNQEMSALQATVSKLMLELEQKRERGRQGVREAAKAEQRARDLKLELATTQASHKESMELLAECSREVVAQRSEHVRLQQCLLQLTEERAAQEERVRQLSADLQKVHSDSRCSQEEARACEGRLVELHTQLARSQQWAQQQMTALQSREKEVIMLKMEMASLRENYHAKVAQVEDLYSQMDAVDQKHNAAVCEVEVLRKCLVDARCDSSRLHRESELVVTNVNQWLKEQKHTNEKLALQIKDQNRTIIHLTAERDHLQENVKGLQGEIRRVRAGLDNQRMEAERLKVTQHRL